MYKEVYLKTVLKTDNKDNNIFHQCFYVPFYQNIYAKLTYTFKAWLNSITLTLTELDFSVFFFLLY